MTLLDGLSLLALKGSTEGLSIRIEADDEVIGQLRLINRGMATNPALWELLCRWRAVGMSFFLTRFDPTPAKTKDFLLNFSLPDPRRVLFLVVTNDGDPVGHIGLCNISGTEAELDNVLRGSASGDRRLMRGAATALLDWTFTALGVRHVVLSVLAENHRAVRFYERLGFRTTRVTPLRSKTMPHGEVLEPATSEDANTLETLRFMELRMEPSR